jgi:type VI secretion system secreted protein Hcp
MLCTAATAFAAPEFAVQVTGQIQGQFKGESTRKGFENKFVGLSFDHEVVSPRDAASGQPVGKRAHKPVRITKAWGPASLQFFAALTKNESLTVIMDFFTVDQTGILVLDHTIKLSNASVASYRSHSDSDVNPKAPQADAIELVYQKIELTDHRGKASVMDDWLAPTF